MKQSVVVILALLSLVGCGHPERPRVCARAPLSSQLPSLEQSMVRNSLRTWGQNSCRTDECDFKISRLSNGHYKIDFVVLRDTAKFGCIQVFAGEWTDIYSGSGKAIDHIPTGLRKTLAK